LLQVYCSISFKSYENRSTHVKEEEEEEEEEEQEEEEEILFCPTNNNKYTHNK